MNTSLIGFNPVFDESYEFLINLPQLAIVRFLVKDDEHIGDDFIGQFSIPLTCMKSGKTDYIALCEG